MIRSILLATGFFVAAGVSHVRGQNADEVSRLKERIELLELKLKVAEREIQDLKEENRKLKGGPAMEKTRTLAEVLTSGAMIQGEFKFSNPEMTEGQWKLKIDERTGGRFKGKYSAKITKPNKSDPVEVDAEGTISGNQITFSPVNTVKMTATVTGMLKNDVLELNWDGKAGKAKLIAKIQK